jgi:ribonuclease J
MGTIRQYLKQKVARSFSSKKIDLDVIKKELKDEITHILYDQTRRTPIVIPVINEIGGGGQNRPQQQQGGDARKGVNGQQFSKPAQKKFPPRQVPDTEAVEPQLKTDTRAY